MVEWTLVGREAELERAERLLDREDSGLAGLLLSGPAGVGKSRLAAELAVLATKPPFGFHVERTAGSLAMHSVPFGPFAHLVPASEVEDRLQLLQTLRLELKRRAGSRRLALLVDDGHRLEDGSLALLELLAKTRDAFLILTMRTTDPVPDAWRALIGSQRFEPVVVDGLDDRAVGAIVDEVLGPTTPETKRSIIRLAGGSPLLVKELLFHGKHAGTLCQRDGVWVTEGDFGSLPGLIDLTDARIASLSEEGLQLFRELAVGSPLPSHAVDRLDIHERLGELHRAELIVRRNDSIALAHPLYGEVMRSNMSIQRIGNVKEGLADALLQSSPLTPAIELQAATLRLEAGRCPAELAMAGASHALAACDGFLAERFADEAALHDDSWLPHALRGRALFAQQRPDEAERAFMQANIPPDHPDVAARVTWARAMNLAFGLGQLQRAKEVLSAMAESLPEPHATALHADRALINALVGDFDSVLKIGRPLLERKGIPPVIRLKVHVSYTLAQAMRGRLGGFKDHIAEALELADAHRADVPMAPLQIGLNQAFGLTALGQIDRAIDAASAGHERARRDDNLVAVWGGEYGEVLLQAGFVPEALEVFRENQRHMGKFDPFRTDPMFLGVESAARAMIGEHDEAERLLELAEHNALGPDARYATRFGRARGWLASCAGDVEQAVEILAETGRRALESTHVLWGFEVLHDCVRLGASERVAALLRETEAKTEGAAYLSAITAHASALEAGDGEAVEAAARMLKQCGARLLAAEAMAQAARRFQDNADHVAAHRAATLSTIWQKECGNPRTPAVAVRPPALSEREHEIAGLVAGRKLTSPEVARELFVSTRTVDNHLRSVYRKLGLRGRDALAELWRGGVLSSLSAEVE
ncbi:MAG: AAA family ATPase [Deltaproteobacteria bacterium]|nr:AAA family ATPase [Deltaproteobacteria bacterium]